MQTQEQAVLERIKLSRGTTEPSQEAPTENAEAVNVSKDAPVDEVVETEAKANEEVTPETEEPAEEATGTEAIEAETDLFYYDIDGEEVSSIQIKEWKDNGLMQADYTRKSQANADERKVLDADREQLKTDQAKVNDQLAILKAEIDEGVKTPEELTELREYEPEEYIKYTEKLNRRKKLLSEAHVAAPKSVDAAAESQKLMDAHPEWFSDGQQTQQLKDDMKLMSEYAAKAGFTDADKSTLTARDYNVILDAARYKKQNGKNVAIEKKVRKAPVITKPRANAKGIQTDLDRALKAFKANPNDKNAVALRKLKRQINSKA